MVIFFLQMSPTASTDFHVTSKCLCPSIIYTFICFIVKVILDKVIDDMTSTFSLLRCCRFFLYMRALYKPWAPSPANNIKSN
ncbi:hypothetical protein Mapa_009997 [Marchantia paleacea]|nr:hypothetical protein Mapa_009997 [Marchantia paleacea]